MRHTLLIIFSLGTTLVQSQHTWRSLSPVELQRAGISDGIPIPREYSLWQLDEVVLAEFLKSGEIHLPMPDASIKIYTSVELSNMHPKLAEKYPSIKTYEVTDQQEERFRGRVDFSRHGIFAVLETAHGEVYIDAVGPRSSSMHMVYFTRDYKVDPSLRESYVRHEHGFDHLPSDFLTLEPSNSPFQRTANELVNLQVYELALSCTGEYAQKHGGTIEGALSAMNTALTRINFLLEAEVAVRLLLIEDNDSLIFLDGSNDPFTNGDAGQMALENNNFLTMQLPGTGYDVGHVFGTNCGAVVGTSGGIGTVCSGTKGFGSSCEIATNDRFYIGIVCHELGHQFGARHTWNNCPPVSQDQYSSSTAYEPGSGSTIMSYAGTCGDQNIQFDSDPYYHINSIVDIMSFISNGGGQGCADPEVTANHKPGLSVPYVDGFSIPISTPFKLVAEGEDSDGDPITFSWEQYDPGVGAGANTPIGEPQGSAPLFRSAPPSSTPVRIFPSMQKVLNNSFDDTEVLPDYGRNLTFRVTARDHRSAGGGVSWTQVAFKSSTAAGPFTVSSFNVPDTIETGEFVEIRWDVANTDQTPVNCKRIHILLSTDGGSSFSDTLISNSANDGSEMVLIPNLITNRARILVEAADNIFFDVNDQNITIRDAQIAGFGVDLLPHSQRVCLPDQIELELQSFPLGGFTDSIELGIIKLPDDVLIGLPAKVLPGDSISIAVDFRALTKADIYEIEIFTFHPQIDTAFRSIEVEAVSSDFSDQQLLQPAEGTSGVTIRPAFSWDKSINADRYNIQLSASPRFDNNLIGAEIDSSVFIFDSLLHENTLYYWRIQPSNVCGEGSYSTIQSFHTLNLACETFEATDLPQNLSQSSTPSIQSVIEVEQTGQVSDVNVPLIAGFHEAFNNLTFELVGPSGQSVKMISGECGFSNRQFRLGFDDESAQAFTCQTSFTGQIFRPTDSLNQLAGEEITGTWSLLIIDSMVGAGGMIDDWKLELCGSITPISPHVVNLDTLRAVFGQIVPLVTAQLSVTDDEAEPEAVIYTMVRLPLKGTLRRSEIPLSLGSQFSQSDIDEGLISYLHTANDSLSDAFSFTVIDGTGGWLSIQELPITISDQIVSTIEFIDQSKWSLFPNPSSGEVNLEYSDIDVMKIELWTIDGHLVMEKQNPDRSRTLLKLGTIPEGAYVVRILTDDMVGYKRLILY